MTVAETERCLCGSCMNVATGFLVALNFICKSPSACKEFSVELQREGQARGAREWTVKKTGAQLHHVLEFRTRRDAEVFVEDFVQYLADIFVDEDELSFDESKA